MGKLIRVENMNVRKPIHPVYRMPDRPCSKQKATARPLRFAVFLALMALPFTTAGAEDFSSLPQMPETPALDFSEDLHTTPARTKTIVQAYEIWDTQYCELTPMPFL